MHNGDVLGDEGRKALNACVKVKIHGKPEVRRYDRTTAVERLLGCYARCEGLGFWRNLDRLLLPSSFGEQGYCKETIDYNIIDIYDALVNFDKMKCVEKYPKEGPGSDKLRNLIDKRRADVEREFEEAKVDPDRRRKYSWVVAQRRVRDCFAGNLTEDRCLLVRKENELVQRENESYSIIDIHNAFVHWEKHREKAEADIDASLKEHAEAVAAADTNIEHTLGKYPRCEAIFRPLQKYPDEGPGSEELKKLIDEHRDELEEEYRKAQCETGSKPVLHEYYRSEAERRVRDCFAGTLSPGFLGDTEIFFMVNKDESERTYDIFDIKCAVDHFDEKKLVDIWKYDKEETSCDRNQRVDEQRASIQSEYDEATSNSEIEHGSGFIVHDHFMITNRHVIETYLDKPESYEIYITNAAIGDRELACKVAHYDAGKDLALLYCPNLNLEQSGICPLHLSSQSLLPGMSIFSFGYPMSHTGETALFVSGSVSGSKKTPAGHSMVVLNCSLNSGNSGGPVMCWVKGQLRVVGVATQKHFKEILKLEERVAIENIRKSLQTCAISDVPGYVGKWVSLTEYYSRSENFQTPMFLLTFKLYDALETHSQFNLSNALPGHLVVDFIEDSISKYTGEYKEELAEVIKLSEDHVNILPSGHLSPSQCCIQ